MGYQFAPQQRRINPKHHTKNQAGSTLQNPESLSLDYLQRTIGNRATIAMLQRKEISVNGDQVTLNSGAGNMMQLGRKKKRKRRKKRGGGGGGQARNTPTTSQAPQQTWSQWFWSWAPSYTAPETDEDDEVEIEDDPNLEVDESIAEIEEEFGQEPEGEDEGFKNPFAIEKLEIDLGEVDFSSDGTMLGNMKGKTKSSISGSGAISHSGKVETEGAYGTGEASGKYESGPESMSGEGKAGFLLGATDETKFGSLGWQTTTGGGLVGSGKMENKVGLSSELAAKIAYNLQKMEGEASGKLEAFFGASTETSVDIKLKANGKDLATTEGKIGLSYGLGGEISGFIKWDSGTLTFGNAGKLSAGVGFSYGYSVKIDTNAIVSTGAQTAKSGASWLWSWIWG